MILRKNYSFEVDVWSVGVLLFELCSGKAPFDA
jgi:serine/threonine protein kinase